MFRRFRRSPSMTLKICSVNTIVNRLIHNIDFVPKHSPATQDDINRISDFILNANNLLILSGAGISTESGIPDYRSEGVGLYARSDKRPVKFQAFVSSKRVRKSYWARNYLGWPRFSSFNPNATHNAISELENKLGRISCVVTQNVDRLHSKAGSQNVIELHGSPFRVICLTCHSMIDRYAFQDILFSLNPKMSFSDKMMRPDGDVEMTQEEVEEFIVPSCQSCGGVLKPDVVFFGENVPRQRVEDVREQVKLCDSLLILGSTLSVFSAYRIVLQAVEYDKPIAIVNIGWTRGDVHACIKVDAKCGDIIPKIKW